MRNIIKEFYLLKKDSKKVNPYRVPSLLCSIKLDYLSLEDTFFLKIHKNGILEIQAYDKESRQEIVIQMTCDNILVVLNYLQNLYPKRIQKNDYKPEVIFFYENFSNVDIKTKQLFTNICVFLKIPVTLLVTSNRFQLHIICRLLAKKIMNCMIQHEEYILKEQKSFSGYYWGLFQLKKMIDAAFL